VTINGTYFTGSSSSTTNVAVKIGALQMKAVEGFTDGAIKNARGFLFGNISFNGALNKPSVDGSLSFNNAGFNLTALNNVRGLKGNLPTGIIDKSPRKGNGI